MRRFARSWFGVLLAWTCTASVVQAIPPAQRTQLVLLCFDTTPGPRQPVESTDYYNYFRAVNHRRADGAPRAGYTLFLITGGLQFDPASRRLAERELPFRGILPRNRPIVHYASDLDRVLDKVRNIRALAQAGVEMGSHAVRHDHGRDWDLARWRHEIADVQRISDLHGLPRPVGFRAPFLEWNEDLYTALREHGYRYDVSRTGNGNAWPARHPRTGLWTFHIPSVRLPGRADPVLYFDDNVRVLLEREARARGLHGAAAERWMDDTYVDVSLTAFEQRYYGNRAPFVVGGHGSFRTATVRLMRQICHRPQVHCATFSQAVEYLEAHPELEGAPALHGQMAAVGVRRGRGAP